MNLVGHVAVGLRATPDASPVVLVGCMLPDLAAMARVRLTAGLPVGALADGVALHHASDAVFHASAWFNEQNQTLRDAMLDAGVDRGAARACAHAGLEMLLDGELMDDPAVAQGAERAFAELTVDGSTMRDVRALAQPETRASWGERLAMIGSSLDARAYATPSAVAYRLHRMTSGRTRIELRAAQIDAVAGVLTAHQPQVVEHADTVVRDVVAEVLQASAVTARRGRGRSHRRPA